MPKIEEFEFKSRHLGLVQSIEIDHINNKIDMISEIVKSNINIKELMRLMTDIEKNESVVYRKRNIKVGIAMYWSWK